MLDHAYSGKKQLPNVSRKGESPLADACSRAGAFKRGRPGETGAQLNRLESVSKTKTKT